jgi:hypothetical protein
LPIAIKLTTLVLASKAQEMDYNTFGIDLADLHAVEETLRYVEEHGSSTTYDGLVKHLSWYWRDHGTKKEYRPKGWMLAWIKCLIGEN